MVLASRTSGSSARAVVGNDDSATSRTATADLTRALLYRSLRACRALSVRRRLTTSTLSRKIAVDEMGNDGGTCSGILIVDDDPDIRDSLKEVLEDEGYEVNGVANGREALDYLRKSPRPCVILLDLMMPVMDGWQFRREQ